MKRVWGVLASAMLAGGTVEAQAPFVLRFDDLLQGAASRIISSPYQGVTFAGTAVARCMARPAVPVGCGESSYGSGDAFAAAVARGTETAAMDWFSGASVMNVSAGFTTAFSLFYANPFGNAVSVQVWSGLDGTGTLLATLVAGRTANGAAAAGCFGLAFCPLVAGAVTFDGVAQSVRFIGATGVGQNGRRAYFDDVTFGSANAGLMPLPNVVPEPSTYLLFGSGLAVLMLSRRSRRRVS